VFVGLISYSFYLWHWPVVAYANYKFFYFDRESWILKILVFVLSIVLGVLSWHWIEQPFRKKKVIATRKGILRLAGCVTALLVILGGSIALFEGVPSRVPRLAYENDLARMDRGFTTSVATEDLVANRVPQLGSRESGAAVKVLLWGDSHAMHAAEAVALLCEEMRCAVEVVAFPATPPLIDEVFVHHDGLSELGPEWAEAVIGYVRKRGIKNVVLAAKWSFYQRIDAERLESGLRATIRRLQVEGSTVFLLQQVLIM
jgi:hypothetical protein